MKKKAMMKAKAIKTISPNQAPGEFTQKTLTVSERTCGFKINNEGVDHGVGFVLVEKANDISKPKNHTQTAYVT